MLALHANAMMHHEPFYVVLAFLVGVFASGLAIFFAFEGIVRPPLLHASIALGLAIAGMHYTAMTGMTLHTLPGTVTTEGTALSRDLLAVIVAVVAFGTTSAFLLALVPDGAPDLSGIWPSGRSKYPRGVAPAIGSVAISSTPIEQASTAQAPSEQPVADRLVAERATSEVLDGASPSAEIAQPSNRAAVIPVQKAGAIHYLPVGQILAVKAEAHYTTVFDGTHKFFCTLSITDIEARLDQSRFARVHRSYIVAVDRISSLKKSGGGGVAELSSPTPYSLPISRRKLSELKALIEARTT
jgi:hypothetical protein